METQSQKGVIVITLVVTMSSLWLAFHVLREAYVKVCIAFLSGFPSLTKLEVILALGQLRGAEGGTAC